MSKLYSLDNHCSLGLGEKGRGRLGKGKGVGRLGRGREGKTGKEEGGWRWLERVKVIFIFFNRFIWFFYWFGFFD